MRTRPMTPKDFKKMFEWKNYPETRQFAIVSHDEIKWEDHLKYMEANHQHFKILMNSNYVIGAVRVQDGEISIWIDKKFWGAGLATQGIKKQGTGLIAKIVNGNIASMRAFINAGYKPIQYIDGYYIFAN